MKAAGAFMGSAALLALADLTWKLGQTCCALSKGITKETASSFAKTNGTIVLT
jgi:hypothetical protein